MAYDALLDPQVVTRDQAIAEQADDEALGILAEARFSQKLRAEIVREVWDDHAAPDRLDAILMHMLDPKTTALWVVERLRESLLDPAVQRMARRKAAARFE